MKVLKSGQVVLRSSRSMENVVVKQQELSTPISDVLREWQDKETMELLGNQIWNEMNEEKSENMYGEGNIPA